MEEKWRGGEEEIFSGKVKLGKAVEFEEVWRVTEMSRLSRKRSVWKEGRKWVSVVDEVVKFNLLK